MSRSLILILTCWITWLSICEGRKSEDENKYEDDEGMGGCYGDEVPKEDRIPPPICNGTLELQKSPCPFNITTKWCHSGHGTGNFEVCISSSNDKEPRIYTLKVKEMVEGKEVNPRHGNWKHMGNELCCFANGRSVEEMKKELNADLKADNYFEKAVVWESSDVDHCGKWHPKIEPGHAAGNFKFIAVVCDGEQRCWKNEAESSNQIQNQTQTAPI